MDDIYNEVLKFYNKRYGQKYFVPYVIIFILQIILLILLIIFECCCRKKNNNNENKPSFKRILTFDLSSINNDEDTRTEGGVGKGVKVAKKCRRFRKRRC